MDPQGRRGAPHARRGPRAQARGAAPRTRARRERLGSVKLALDAGERSGKLVAELEGVTQALRRRATSCATSTCASCAATGSALLGPQRRGQVDAAEADPGPSSRPTAAPCGSARKLDVAYFDQMREQLDPERTLADTISPGSEWIETADGRKHVLTLSRRFPVSAAARERAGEDAVGRRAQSAAARAAVRAAGEPAGAGRADERSRHRVARAAGRDAAVVSGHAARRQPRPRVPRQRRHADARRRGRRQVAASTSAATATGSRSAPPIAPSAPATPREARLRAPRARAPRARAADVQRAARARCAAGRARSARARAARADRADERARLPPAGRRRRSRRTASAPRKSSGC